MINDIPTDATITIRIIKNFEYRTVKNLVLRNIKLETTTVGDLKKLVIEKINATSTFKPFRNVDYENETELSFFNREAYETYKLHPDVMKWE
ncbi:8609_t:CDS:2 [Cetraspora pellucida]|uniref:8609_t:CDS:1 n=1 Tax=Cetraspora pellucida TaxID=1433469 RepID=A0ACA9LZV8_9GLOM|nr:8609_t:CDS:2 [Cetraspora pellucida]